MPTEHPLMCGHCRSDRTHLDRGDTGLALICFDCGWRMPTEEMADGGYLIHPDPAFDQPSTEDDLSRRLRLILAAGRLIVTPPDLQLMQRLKDAAEKGRPQ